MSRFRLEVGAELATVVPASMAGLIALWVREGRLRARDAGLVVPAEVLAVAAELDQQAAVWRARAMSACPVPMSDAGGGGGHGRRVAAGSSSGSVVGSFGVAARLGLSDRHVRRLAAAGVLPGERDGGGRWQFEAAAVEIYREHIANGRC